MLTTQHLSGFFRLFFLTCILLFLLHTNVIAQKNVQYEKPEIEVIKKDNDKLHNDFYVSVSAGLVWGSVFDSYKKYDYIYKGTSSMFDLKIGGAVTRNLILHATIVGISNNNPMLVDRNDNTQNNMGKKFSLQETMLGVGITYYWMPFNLLTSISVGSGQFTLINESQHPHALMSPRAPGIQVKVGKDWIVAKKWGIGVATIYHHTSTSNSIDGFTEKIYSHRIGFLLNATFN